MSTTIEATCTTCGTINRVGEADVPPGAKFVPCVSCKSRVALPPGKAARATPPPVPSRSSELGIADLPAPKRQSPLADAAPSRPAPRSALADADLPAPRGPRTGAPSTPPLNTSASGTFDLDALMPADEPGLPAPKTRSTMDVADLPAPRAAAPRSSGRGSDLPIPDVADLPTPASAKAPAPRASAPMPSVSDLPTPKSRQPSVSDLPAPVARGVSDLPTPRGPSGVVDLPTPRGPSGVVDLPTPKPGGIVDLPTPRQGGGADVPAPKGFFDDLPQPSRNPPASKDLPAPKGFFDDLPGRVSTSKPEVPAPKGFFDDLPGRQSTAKAAAANTPEVPAPKGFFDDLPQPANPGSQVAPKGFFDDLPQPAKAASQAPMRTEKPANAPVELSMESAGPALDLGIDEGSQARRFDDLDLSVPSTGIKIESKPAGARPNTPSAPPLPAFRHDQAQPATLELAEPRVIAPSQKLGPKRKSETSLDPEAARAKARRVRLLALVGFAVVALGAGGFYFYSKWAAKRAVANTIAEELAKANDALGKADAMHWDRAVTAAAVILDADNAHAEALGISSEALLASAIATGIGYNNKVVLARNQISKAVGENIAGPHLIRAQALNAITQGDGKRALDLLKPMVPADSKDPTLLLYLSWANAAAADPQAALKTYAAAIANSTDYLKATALFGRGRVKLELGDLEGATADFRAVLEVDKNHIGAQVDLAAAMPASQATQQEKDLMALLERKDLASGDPRAVVKAWTLAAEAAKRGGRLDAARERYRNALSLMPDDLGALAGAAEVELRDGKLEQASEQIGRALTLSKDDVRSQLVQSEISIAKNDIADAAARLDVLSRRNPPPPPLDQARIKLALGMLADKANRDEEAAALYEQAAELAGEADLTPTLTAVGKYTAIADRLDDQNRAAELRGKASKLLEKLETQADKDPAIALALGAAYLRTNDPAKAEPWLRKVVEARPDDAEGQFQLAKALARLDRIDDAITRLNRAIELAPKRHELRVELGRTYERAKQDDKAAEIYNQLLDVLKDQEAVEVRAAAGRFFARRGEKEKAGEQGEAILKVVPNHVAGMFLKAEGQLARNQLDDALMLFGKAAAAERDALYFDGLGRANEVRALQSNDVKAQARALDAYKTASQIDPRMKNPHAGTGRLYISRKDWKLAIEALRAANAIDPTDADVMFLVGLAMYNLKDVEPAQGANAKIWLKNATDLKPNAEAYFYLGMLAKDPPVDDRAAAVYLEKARGLGAKEEQKTGKTPWWYMEALYRLGETHLAIGPSNYEQAKDAWKAWVDRGPKGDIRLKNVLEKLATTLPH